jgi:hypothetical protein
MKLPGIVLFIALAGACKMKAYGEFSVGARMDGYSNFQNYASGLMGLDFRYNTMFLPRALPLGGGTELRFGGRIGLLFDGLYNVESKALQPRFFPVFITIQPLLFVDFRIKGDLSLRLGTADGVNIIFYPQGVISPNFNFHAYAGLAYRITERWGIEFDIGWGDLGKWSFWNGPQFSLGTFFSMP